MSETVTIEQLEGEPSALLSWYPQQQSPQDCYIELSLRDGRMRADSNGEIGNALPSDVWHGIVRRYPIPLLQRDTVNALMEEIKPHAQQVLEHAEIVWNGSNHIGHLDAVALEAEQRIAGESESYSGLSIIVDGAEVDIPGHLGIVTGIEPDLYVWDAQDWLSGVKGEVIDEMRAGKSVADLVTEYDGDGTDEDRPVVIGLEAYLERLKDEMEEEEA